MECTEKVVENSLHMTLAKLDAISGVQQLEEIGLGVLHHQEEVGDLFVHDGFHNLSGETIVDVIGELLQNL